ncbi:MAG: enoyl-CoA hydratase/isomerase family protein [Clostridia bacterium]|nr:MAG: enoyl-CoA hydratase/isomerase family protein [Clostridia bacterium]
MGETLETIRTEIAGKVLTITLNRPKQMNAISKKMISELKETLSAAQEDPEVWAIILTGNEKVFSAGIDIGEIKEFAGPFAAFAASRRFQDLMVQIENLPKPVIAAVNGMALGGGFELMISCDLRVAALDARLGTPEVGLGTIPAGGGTTRLPRMLPFCKAMELLLLGEPVSGSEAAQLGIVNKAVANTDVLATAQALAERITEKSPLAVSRIKEIARSSVEVDMLSTLRIEAQSLAILSTSEDYKEGTNAFFARREPEFKGK